MWSRVLAPFSRSSGRVNSFGLWLIPSTDGTNSTALGVMALMARHGGPLDSLCRHVELGGHLITISATIFLPAAMGFWICFGYPCRGGYRFFSVKDGEPQS